jgi:hypothetical protein
MKRTGCVLILLCALASSGCAQRDWVSETLTLVDVTGTWAGTVTFWGSGCSGQPAGNRGCPYPVQLVLRQRGASVIGEVAAASGRFGGDKVKGVINGELFTFELGALRGEASVSGDDMDGRAGGPTLSYCPCTISLHRADTADTMRQGR